MLLSYKENEMEWISVKDKKPNTRTTEGKQMKTIYAWVKEYAEKYQRKARRYCAKYKMGVRKISEQGKAGVYITAEEWQRVKNYLEGNHEKT